MAKAPCVYLHDSIIAELRARGENRSQVINRDLERLYTLYKRALREVPLTVGEACLIVDVLNGTLMDANTARLLWANVEDGIKLDGLDKKWSVDGGALVARLQGLSDVQALAVVDAAERFWEMPDITTTPAEEAVQGVFVIKE